MHLEYKTIKPQLKCNIFLYNEGVVVVDPLASFTICVEHTVFKTGFKIFIAGKRLITVPSKHMFLDLTRVISNKLNPHAFLPLLSLFSNVLIFNKNK